MENSLQHYLRAPLRFDSQHATRARSRPIEIHHPAYAEGASLLFGFRGHDSPSGGLNARLMHTACAIVADNRFDGFLSREKIRDARPFELAANLEPGIYYFHVPRSQIDGRDIPPLTPGADPNSSGPYLYPIVPNFSSWTFPHQSAWSDILEELWSSAILQTGEARTGACVLTGHINAIDEAHIVPAGEAEWFLNNDMAGRLSSREYPGTPNSFIDDQSNTIRLRTDLHRLWDSKRLTFVPKRCGNFVCMYAHCFDSDEQLVELYHNRPLPNLYGVSPECFFARFACNLFPLSRFLSVKRGNRLLRTRNDLGQAEDKEYSGDECMPFMKPSRSTSPRKRRSPEHSQSIPRTEQYESRFEITSSGCKRIRRHSSDYDSGFASSFTDDGGEELRGRARQRRCDS